MTPARAEAGRHSPAALALWGAVAGTCVTIAVVALPFLRFAYEAPALHVVLETLNAVAASLVAFLFYGRYREHERLQDFLLALALGAVAVANLVLTALPTALTLGGQESLTQWVPLAVRVAGAGLFCAASLTPAHVLVAPARAQAVVLAHASALFVVTVAALAAGRRLPAPLGPGVTPTDASQPLLVAHGGVTAAAAASVLLYAVGAVAFVRQAARTGDELVRWVGAGAVLAAFAWVHYLLYPSLYSDYVYSGDLLRGAFYGFLVVGAAREIACLWDARADVAVLEDRRRLARDLHDGLTQELTYIWTQSRRLSTQPEAHVVAERIGGAAARGLDEARRSIAALTRPEDASFEEVLRAAADELAGRYEAKVHVDVAQGLTVPPAEAEALLRITAEAVRNAILHGRATHVDVSLAVDPLALVVRDDGRGFGVGRPAEARPGGFGMTSMRERAASIGARFEVESAPDEGTTVRVTRP